MSSNFNKQQYDFNKQKQVLTVQIRKKKHEEIFKKKRNISSNNDNQQNPMNQQPVINPKKPLIIDQQRRHQIQKFIQLKYFPHMFPALVKLLFGDSIFQKHQGIIGIRKILSTDNEPPIYLVFEHKILPIIIQLLRQNQFPHLKLQATWIVSNIATGAPEQIQALLLYDVIPILLSFLRQNIYGIADQAIWAIGNLAGDCSQVRDKIIDEGGINAVIYFTNNTQSVANQIQGAWALSNLCRGNPLPVYQKVALAVPTLCKVIKSKKLDVQNLGDCVWALTYLTQGPKVRLKPLFDYEMVPTIIQTAKSPFMPLATPSLRILGNISTGNEAQTQQLLKNGILQTMQQLLQSGKSLIRRQACWILSNIAAGTRYQVERLLIKQQLINKICYLFQNDSVDIKKQICHIFANMVYLGDIMRVKSLILDKQIMKYYGQCIVQKDSLKLLQACLDCLPLLLQFGQKTKEGMGYNIIKQKFLSYPGVALAFESLHQAQSQKIYNKAQKIYTIYFSSQQIQNKQNQSQMENKHNDSMTI